MPAAASAWAWSPHVLGWVVVTGLGAVYAASLKHLGPRHAWPSPTVTPRQWLSFVGGLVALALAFTWPLADLAVHRSLLAHMAQLFLLALVAPALLLLGLPRWLIDLTTRPAPVDAALRRASRPVVASLAFNAVVVGSLMPPVIAAGARNGAVAAAAQASLLAAGTLMWIPALRMLPGPAQLTTAGRIAYLFLQSLLPNFPALVFIFASHPIYPVFAAHSHSIGLSPLADQRLAGVLAKLGGISVLWGAAAVVLIRAQRAEEAGRDPDPLTWDDVERELRRLERRPGPTDAADL